VITFRKIYCKPKTHISHTKATVNQDLRTDLFKNRPFLVWLDFPALSQRGIADKNEKRPDHYSGLFNENTRS
jgi:hypothetical protein